MEPPQTLTSGPHYSVLLAVTGGREENTEQESFHLILAEIVGQISDIDHENVRQVAPIVDVDAGGAAHGHGVRQGHGQGRGGRGGGGGRGCC